MTKAELMETLAAKKGIRFKKSEEIITTIFDSMTDALCSGEGIYIRGFGTFTIRDYKAYTGRNPKSGDTVEVKPKKLPFFKVGKELGERVTS